MFMKNLIAFLFLISLGLQAHCNDMQENMQENQEMKRKTSHLRVGAHTESIGTEINLNENADVIEKIHDILNTHLYAEIPGTKSSGGLGTYPLFSKSLENYKDFFCKDRNLSLIEYKTAFILLKSSFCNDDEYNNLVKMVFDIGYWKTHAALLSKDYDNFEKMLMDNESLMNKLKNEYRKIKDKYEGDLSNFIKEIREIFGEGALKLIENYN